MSSNKCASPGCNKPCHGEKEMCLDHHKESDYTYGLDAELKKKMEAKFDSGKAAQAQAWLEQLTNTRAHGTFQEYLKNGIVLCKAINAIKPGSVRAINTQSTPFKERENVANYLAACQQLGMRSTDVFMTQDLYENANMGAVVDNLHSLGSLSRKIAGFSGPFIGVKMADENRRNFPEEVLKKEVQSRQTVGSYGYQDETKNPTLARQIIKDVSGHKASEAVPKLAMGSYGIQQENRGPALDKIIKNPELLEANRTGAITSPSSSSSSSSAAAAAGGSKFCSKCGTKREGTANFCSNCGSGY